MNLNNEKKTVISVIIFSLLVFVIMSGIYTLNKLQPLFLDDFDYSYINGTDKKVNSLKDIMISQYNHYFKWGGRTVAHSIGQFFLWKGKSVFNIFNTVVSAVLFVLMLLHVNINYFKEKLEPKVQ